MAGRGNKEIFSVQVMQFADALLVWLAFMIGSWLRDPLINAYNAIPHPPFGVIFKQGATGLAEISWLLVIMVPFTPLTLERLGFYRDVLRRTTPKALWLIVWAFGLLGFVVTMLAVFFKLNTSSRATLLVAIPLAGVLLLLRDWFLRRRARKVCLTEDRKESILLAGTPDDTARWLESIPAEEKAYWRVAGHFDLRTGDWDALGKLLDAEAVERVIFAADHTMFESVAAAIEACECRGVEVWVAAGFIQTQVARPTFDFAGGRPMLVLKSTPELSWELLAKTVMDKVGALMLLAFSWPLWLVAVVGIKLQSPGPVFYAQERAGRYGKPFRMWKFRTMVPDADKRLEELKEGAGNQMSGPVFKLDRDPRIFPLGRLLRKYSIDELPQLLNVLAGDMSLVGPRPMALYELPNIEKSYHRRKLSVKPGLTCIWQVSGRNEISDFDEWVKLDLQYIDNWSLWLDFVILLKTIPAVLFAKGAK